MSASRTLAGQHVTAKEGAGDEYGKSTLTFGLDVLSQLLFCDFYSIESALVVDGKLSFYVRYTGDSTPIGAERVLCWDMRHIGNEGTVHMSVSAINPTGVQKGEQ